MSFSGGQTIRSIRLRVEPINTNRSPNINLLHMRFQKGITLPGGQRVTVKTNIFNMLNTNVIESINTLSGRTYLRPDSVMDARIVEFAVDYRF